jgi:small subunit ribosomal protein S21
MPKVELRTPRESFDQMFRRFKTAVDEDDRLNDIRKHECYERPSIHKKRAKAIAKKRAYMERMGKNPKRMY